MLNVKYNGMLSKYLNKFTINIFLLKQPRHFRQVSSQTILLKINLLQWYCNLEDFVSLLFWYYVK